MIRSNICVFVQFHESFVTIFLKIIIVHRENSFWTVIIGKGVFISNWFPIYFLGSSFSPGDLLPVEKQTLTAVETEDRFLVEDSTVEVSLARSTKSKTTGKPISWKRNFSSIKNREIEFILLFLRRGHYWTKQGFNGTISTQCVKILTIGNKEWMKRKLENKNCTNRPNS